MSCNTVLLRVLQQCRTALLGGCPLIYIRTNSDIFIHKLITCENDPLVVLLSNGNSQGTGAESELKRGRPLYELTNPTDKLLKYCQNYKFGLPSTTSNIPANWSEGKMNGPQLWVFKMPNAANASNLPNLEKYYRDLENYVLAHENPNNPEYKFLQSSAVILYSLYPELPEALKIYTEFIDVDYPDEEEIRGVIKTEASGDPIITKDEKYLSTLSTDFLGFTSEEVELTMRRIISTNSLGNPEKVEEIINKRKAQRLQGGLLEQCKIDDDIGGMSQFKLWLNKQVEPLRNSSVYKKNTGTLPPKGVLLCGIPGCGKSLAAKFTAKTLNLMTLLKMDISSLMDKFVGSSEQKMRDTLKLAEAMSPCVLWIDELEKGFSGASSDGNDGSSAAFKRMFGYMLGWMQDNTSPCFIFATANDIGGLPKEFFRSGRFDALFAVYLPTMKECSEIFQVSMRKAAQRAVRNNLFNHSCYSREIFERLIDEKFVSYDGRPRIIIGSDIQKIVNIALRNLINISNITGEDWEKALRRVINEPAFSVYGDSEENIDSIAVSYCRMLRKGFISVSSENLFRNEDYRVKNAERYSKLKNLDTEKMSNEEKTEHEKNLHDAEILQRKEPNAESKYDKAVYAYLQERINDIASRLEKHESEIMLRR